MSSESKSRKRDAFIARAERAGVPSVSMMAVPHTTDVSVRPDEQVTATDATRARSFAQRLVGPLSPAADALARVDRLAACLEALMVADRAESGGAVTKRRANG